jgi:hypothetical protein
VKPSGKAEGEVRPHGCGTYKDGLAARSWDSWTVLGLTIPRLLGLRFAAKRDEGRRLYRFCRKFCSRRSCRGSGAGLGRELGGQRVELFGRSEALVSLLDHQLPFLDHVHEFDADERGLRRAKRFEP